MGTANGLGNPAYGTFQHQMSQSSTLNQRQGETVPAFGATNEKN